MLFFKSKDTEVFKADRNKLFASNKKQIDNHTLMLDMLRSNMSVVCTCHCWDVFINIFLVWLLFFVDLCSQKATKGTELSFLCKQGTLPGGRVEDHRMMFPRHLHLPQLYIQAIPYIYKTDYMMSLTLHTLISVCIFSILSSMGDPKTLTPGPWTPLRTGCMDYLTDRSTDPFYGPPQKIAKK